MAVPSFVLQANGHFHRGFVISRSSNTHRDRLKTSIASTIKAQPFFKEFQQFLPMKLEDISKAINETSERILDVVVDSIFKFVDQPLLPTQKNFAPVEEIGDIVEVTCTEGNIPLDFPQGAYIRNGSNPLFGGNKSAISIFGQSSHTWVEGEGMLHALYFKKLGQNFDWTISYNNRFVESQTFKMEKKKNKPCFIPAVEGDAPAIIAAYFVNMMRFGEVNKHMRNTSVFEHAGKIYAVAENHLPQEIDIRTLNSYQDWNIGGAWSRTFNSHPKKAPTSGELVIMGVDATKPYYVLGVVSCDGKNLLHKVDLEFNRSVISHEVGVTEKYNVIMDCPLVVDGTRLVKGGSLMKFEKDGYTRIGVMPRYGDARSVKWFEVQPNCTFHLINCFEEGNQVIVRGCRARESVLPGPERGKGKHEWFSKGFTFKNYDKLCSPIISSSSSGTDYISEEGFLFTHAYEWRLNMENGKVEETFLTGNDYSMDYPFINETFTGLKHKYAYTQVVDSIASSTCGKGKFGSLAKLHLEEIDQYEAPLQEEKCRSRKLAKIEYHKLDENSFCSGSCFVAKHGAKEEEEEDDGWILSFVHNEDTHVTQVHVIDAKRFEEKPVAKITLPQRVPYGFHGTFVSFCSENI